MKLIQVRNAMGMLMIVLVTASMVVSCTSTVQTATDEIMQELFVPKDAVEIGRFESSKAIKYARGCNGMLVEIAYGTNRPFSEVAAEYDQVLHGKGWQASRSYDPNKTTTAAFYERNSSTEVQIDLEPVWVPESEIDKNRGRFSTIYAVLLHYVAPSLAECYG